MRELGVNLIRTYYPPPPWLFEAAARAGLRFLVGIPWRSHTAFLDSQDQAREVRQTVRSAISELRPFSDAIFAYNLGNEIRSDIVRWQGPRAVGRFINQLLERSIRRDFSPTPTIRRPRISICAFSISSRSTSISIENPISAAT